MVYRFSILPYNCLYNMLCVPNDVETNLKKKTIQKEKKVNFLPVCMCIPFFFWRLEARGPEGSSARVAEKVGEGGEDFGFSSRLKYYTQEKKRF